MIPLSEPVIQGNEWKYIKDCLDTGWVSSVGQYVDRFEKMIAEYVEAKYAIAMVNGTAGLHLSLLVSGVHADDEVLVPTLTFIAPVNAIRYCNATPIFFDCDDTCCIDTQKVRAFLQEQCFMDSDGFTYNKYTKKRISAMIAVHIFGHPCDMDTLRELSTTYNIRLIEDASESLGSLYKNKKTGCLGDIGIFSFNGNKIITTGGGGMIVTNNEEYAIHIRHLSTQAKKAGSEYDHDEIGYNYRLTNIQAAMGVAQMEKIDEYLKIKRENFELFRSLLNSIPQVELLQEKPWAFSNCWFYTLKFSSQKKQALLEYLISEGVQVRPIWKLNHTLPMYEKYQKISIERAREMYGSCINIPCSVNLTEEQIVYTVERIKKFLII